MKNTDTILLAHGGGGRSSRDLIEKEIVSRLYPGGCSDLPDAAALKTESTDLAFTTDSFVVSPAFFPGGNIGEICVYGTVNDLAVSGARPEYLSLAFILEDGYPLSDFRRILDSIRHASHRCGTRIVTGDTKVVAAGQCDGIYINTAGIGTRIPGFSLSPARLAGGDSVIVSGTIAEHGLAVMCARSGIEISNGPQSDSAPVHRLVNALADMPESVRFMRDPTRGGLSAVLNEITENAPIGIVLREESIPLSPACRSASEMLGLDPLHIASEGRIVAVCSPDAEEEILKRWRALPEGSGAVKIGSVTSKAGTVILETLMGGRRLVDLPKGELLPRIC